jgi:hypothetical protein
MSPLWSVQFFFFPIHDFAFQFCNMEKLVTFPKKIAKLVEFKLEKNSPKLLPIFFFQKK